MSQNGIGWVFQTSKVRHETDTAEETLDELKKLINGYNIKDLKISWCCWK